MFTGAGGSDGGVAPPVAGSGVSSAVDASGSCSALLLDHLHGEADQVGVCGHALTLAFSPISSSRPIASSTVLIRGLFAIFTYRSDPVL